MKSEVTHNKHIALIVSASFISFSLTTVLHHSALDARQISRTQSHIGQTRLSSHNLLINQHGNGIWKALRQCESNANYRADTGNGYYGAYQFSISSWIAVG